MIPSAHPHVRCTPMGRACGCADEVELAPIWVEFNGWRRTLGGGHRVAHGVRQVHLARALRQRVVEAPLVAHEVAHRPRARHLGRRRDGLGHRRRRGRGRGLRRCRRRREPRPVAGVCVELRAPAWCTRNKPSGWVELRARALVTQCCWCARAAVRGRPIRNSEARTRAAHSRAACARSVCRRVA